MEMMLKRTTIIMALAALLLTGVANTAAQPAKLPLMPHASSPIVTPTSSADTPTPTATLCPFRYSDVPPNHWAYQFIGQLTCIGAISGYPDGSFRPATNMQRDQVAKVIVLAKGWQIQHLNQIFSDVPPSYWAYDLIQTSYAYAAVTGYRDNQTNHPCADHGVASPCYLPHNNITRAELTSVVVRMQGWAPYDPANPSFTDVPRTYWAYQFIEAGHLHGIINGYPDGSFRPNNNITRAEVCKVVGLGISSP
jgi:S-layer homology domain